MDSSFVMYPKLINIFLTDLLNFYKIYNDAIEKLLNRASNLKPNEVSELYEVTNAISGLKNLKLKLVKKYQMYIKRYTKRLNNASSINYLNVPQQEEIINNLRNKLKRGILDIDFKVEVQSYNSILNALDSSIKKNQYFVTLPRPSLNKTIERLIEVSKNDQILPVDAINDMSRGITEIKLRLSELFDAIEDEKENIIQLEERSDVSDWESETKDMEFDEIETSPRLLDDISPTQRYANLTGILTGSGLPYDSDISMTSPEFTLQDIHRAIEDLKSAMDLQSRMYDADKNELLEFSNILEAGMEKLNSNYIKIDSLLDDIKEVKKGAGIDVSEIETLKSQIFSYINTQLAEAINSIKSIISNFDVPITENLAQMQTEIINQLKRYMLTTMFNEVNISTLVSNVVKELDIDSHLKNVSQTIASEFNDYKLKVDDAFRKQMVDLGKINSDLEDQVQTSADQIDLAKKQMIEHQELTKKQIEEQQQETINLRDSLASILQEFNNEFNLNIGGFKDSMAYIEALQKSLAEQLGMFQENLNSHQEILGKEQNILEDVVKSNLNMKDQLHMLSEYINTEKTTTKEQIDTVAGLTRSLNETNKAMQNMMMTSDLKYTENYNKYQELLQNYNHTLKKYTDHIDSNVKFLEAEKVELNKMIENEHNLINKLKADQDDAKAELKEVKAELEKVGENVKQVDTSVLDLKKLKDKQIKSLNELKRQNKTNTESLDKRFQELITQTQDKLINKIVTLQQKLAELQKSGETRHGQVLEHNTTVLKDLIDTKMKTQERLSLETNIAVQKAEKVLGKLETQYDIIASGVSDIKAKIENLENLKTLAVSAQVTPKVTTSGKRKRVE
ncbi:hypothetical protein PvNV_063 [Penaeus vannamei nudivirus]|nr:hypothetical protein PvSNPV_063 [Penaeus vannamei nucleopolyhedrovirus]